jgi:predicted ATPase
VTSRSTLRLAAEREYVVPALDLPAPEAATPAGVAERYDAVRLFVERARSGRPGFRLTDDNAPDVVAICRRVDGLPLALELAAARMRRLSPSGLLARLQPRLPLLSAGSPTLPQRQRTLRQTISWSFGLLTRREQTLLERLAVFVGGFTVAGAEAVCREDGAPEFDTVDGLDALVGHSLLQPRNEPDGALRFTMLETIREFALERLEASAAYQTVRARHSDFYRTLAEAAGPELTEPGQRVWLDRLERERDDLDAALDWYCEHRPEVALEVATQLAPLWRLRGPFRTGWGWLRRALERAPHAPGEVRALALQRAGELAFRLGDYDAATDCFQDAATTWRGLGRVGGVAHALHLLATLSHRREDYARAERLYGEALALWRTVDDAWGVPISLHALGTVADERGDLERAERLYGEALALWRRTTDTMGVAVSLDALGGLARARGELPRAEALHGEALALKRQLGERRLLEFSLYNLCLDAYLAGDRTRAAALGREAVSLCLELGKTADAARRLEGLAEAAAASGSAAPAAVLLGAAAAIRAEIGVPPRDGAAHGRLLETVRAAVPPPDFAAAWERGRRTAPEQAVEVLMDAGGAPRSPGATPADERLPRTGPSGPAAAAAGEAAPARCA